ncbi:MAG TPA: hypothetical protein VN663_14215 [Ramlibacter sp.]|nr:hypothetical protein [Ramlibacter sp.]
MTKAEIAVRSNRQNQLLDRTLDKLSLKNDAQLAALMVENPAVLSKFRHGRLSLNATYQVKIHELTGWAVLDIRKALGIIPLIDLPEHRAALIDVNAWRAKISAKQAA